MLDLDHGPLAGLVRRVESFGDDPVESAAGVREPSLGDLAIGGAGLVDAKTLAAEHGESYTEDLAGAEVTVRDFGLAKEVVEGLHNHG